MSREMDEGALCGACRCGQHGDCRDWDCMCPEEFCNGWGAPETLAEHLRAVLDASVGDLREACRVLMDSEADDA